MILNKDPLFKTEPLSYTRRPQTLVWQAMHQDYSSYPTNQTPIVHSDSWYGEVVVSKLLAGNRGHWGCLEHPSITFCCSYYPHSVMVQARTHRVGISFDVQSFRYTSEALRLVTTEAKLEEAFYFRPIGNYTDRTGKKYAYTEVQRQKAMTNTWYALSQYKQELEQGFSEEHARESLTTNYRQHFVVSFNLRSLLHFLDLRGKADAQLEIQCLATDLFEIGKVWCPEILDYYEANRWKKAKLSP